MQTLLEASIANAITVAILAPMVWLAARCARQPGVRHSLWLLLLVKLFTPPLVAFSLPEFSGSALRAVFVESPLRVGSASSAAPVAAVEVVAAESPLTLPSDTRPVLTPTLVEMKSTPVTVPNGLPRVPSPTKLGVPEEMRHGMAVALLWLWGAGSVLLASVQLWRIRAFAGSIRRAGHASALLEAELRGLARQHRLQAVPQSRLVNGVVSPMLWGVGRQATILFPQSLFATLTTDARSTLLLHELAHFTRGDHWVRVFEFVVTAVFWWHPAVWWAVREMGSSEEDCCDSWVVARTATSPRCYAEALLDTIDFLCEQQRLVPPVASGLGTPRELRGRLIRIMQQSDVPVLTLTGRVLLVLALVVLPAQPAASSTVADSMRAIVWPEERFGSAVLTGTMERTHPIVAAVGSPPVPAVPQAPAPTGLRRSSMARPWAVAMSRNEQFSLQAGARRRVDLVLRGSSQVTSLADWNISSAAFLQSEPRFVTGGFDRQVRLWDATAGRVLRNFEELDDVVTSVATSPDDRWLVAASRSGVLSLYHVASPERVTTMTCGATINCVRFSPDGRQLALGLGDWRNAATSRLLLARMPDLMVEREIPVATPIGAVGYDGVSNTLQAADWDGLVTYWEPETGAGPLAETRLAKDLVSAAAFSPDVTALSQYPLEMVQRQQIERRAQQAWQLLMRNMLPAPVPTVPLETRVMVRSRLSETIAAGLPVPSARSPEQ